MLVAIAAEKDISYLINVVKSIQHDVDVIEFRLDYLTVINADEIKKAMNEVEKPIIFTLRPADQGGRFLGSESERLDILLALARLEPAYIDLEYTVPNDFLEQFNKQFPTIKIIRSYHNFSTTPEDLEDKLLSLMHPAVHVYKIVTQAQSTLDALRVLQFVKNNSDRVNLVSHCMRPLGLCARIVGAALGNHFTYASINERTSPVSDCPDVATLTDLYCIQHLNKQTQVFALLGDPVEHSVGHLFHNKQFKTRGLNAVYVKILLKQSELTEFFHAIKTLPFYGFSVTMPLKEKVIPYMKVLCAQSESIAAVNTIGINDGLCHATNTDGGGAMDAVETFRPVKGRECLIIGAGGSAKAIAHACQTRQPASLSIINRTLTKAQQLADKVNAHAYALHSFDARKAPAFDLIINTIPNTDDNDASVLELIRPYCHEALIFMNIDYSNTNSTLTQQLAAAGCKIVPPSDMFINQAHRQIQYWFDND